MISRCTFQLAAFETDEPRSAKERKRAKKDLAGVQIDQQYSVYAGIEFYTHLKSNACAEIEIVVI